VVLFSIAIILATGGFFVLLTLFFPVFARLFLSENRKETETQQYAESLFLTRELFATDSRRGILLLLSQFERQVVILPDKGVGEQLTIDVMVNIISKMTQHLKQNEVRNALETGLDELINALCPTLCTSKDEYELSNEIIEEEGE
jgi:putative membrane protein